MLYAADIHIYRKILIRLFSCSPVHLSFLLSHNKIPGRTDPLRHGVVSLSLGGSAANRTSGVHPPVNIRQREKFTYSGRLMGLHFRETTREKRPQYRHTAALRTMNNQEQTTPITLTGEYQSPEFCNSPFYVAGPIFFNHYRTSFFSTTLHAVHSPGDHGSLASV